jgi:uncharacterized OsmC-like protein
MDATASQTAAAGTHTHPAPFRVDLHLQDGYAMEVDPHLAGVDPFVVDEPPPLGAGRGPNPTRLLATALASCLSASLLFSMRKQRIDVRDLRTRATGTLGRNERGRLRVTGIHVELMPTIAQADLERLQRSVQIFEDYCVVTQSVRPTLDVTVTVTPTGV